MEIKEIRLKFGNRLKEIRNEKGFTQEKLAEILSKTTEHISFLERGERSPSFEVLVALAGALNVSISHLVAIEQPLSSELINSLTVAPVLETKTSFVEEPVVTTSERNSDLDRLQNAFEGIRAMQALAQEYGINDILQDNGGKVLQVLILLGLRISPGREGNDAIDADGNEYELKTINRSLNKNAGVTTHHHLNKDILNKYRKVKAWFIAIYEGIELKEIYKVTPTLLEPLFSIWQQRVQDGSSLNNPKIPMKYVRQGELVYPTQSTK